MRWRVVISGGIPNRVHAAQTLGSLHAHDAVMEPRRGSETAIILTIEAGQAADAGIRARRLVEGTMGELVLTDLVIERIEIDHSR